MHSNKFGCLDNNPSPSKIVHEADLHIKTQGQIDAAVMVLFFLSQKCQEKILKNFPGYHRGRLLRGNHDHLGLPTF